MKKILLACNAGMSTSLLVERMKQYAKSQSIDCEIKAMGVLEAEKVLNDWDICLLGPQVRYMLPKFQKKSTKPVVVINTRFYGLMDGANVMKEALTHLH